MRFRVRGGYLIARNGARRYFFYFVLSFINNNVVSTRELTDTDAVACEAFACRPVGKSERPRVLDDARPERNLTDVDAVKSLCVFGGRGGGGGFF